MSVFLEFFINYLSYPLFLFAVEVILRFIPSLKDNTIFGLIVKLLDKIIPNKAKGGKRIVHQEVLIDKRNKNA